VAVSRSFAALAFASVCGTAVLGYLAASPRDEPFRREVSVGPSTSLELGTARLSCRLESELVFVRYEPNEDVAIAYTDHTVVGTPQIVLGLRFLDFPMAARAFIFFHECGHVVLGHVDDWDTIGRTDEQGTAADCFAASETTRQGYAVGDMLAGLEPILWPARLASIRACAEAGSPPISAREGPASTGT
jgi:hypothetical protein